MRKINKDIQKIFKNFFYFIFSVFHGKIRGIILAKNDPRIEILFSDFENRIKYRVFKIKNARLYTDRIQDTAIILDNKIVDGPSHQLRPINNANIEKNIVFTKGTPRIKKKITGTVLSLLTGGAGNDNYFHWIFDVLPRLKICEQVMDLKKIDFFLLPGIEKKYQHESLDIFKIPREKRLSSKNFRHIVADEIIITDHPYCLKNDADNEIENIPTWISKWLKSVCIKKSENIKSMQKKIYIDRKDSTANTRYLRSIINETEVKNMLKKEGFEFISFGDYSFKEQTEIINNSSVIVGLHGAGFANLCFCEPHTKVLELKSKTSGKVCENLALANNLNYKCIISDLIGENYDNQFGHIKVPLDLLKKTLHNDFK